MPPSKATFIRTEELLAVMRRVFKLSTTSFAGLIWLCHLNSFIRIRNPFQLCCHLGG
jgi:hypothetical protein